MFPNIAAAQQGRRAVRGPAMRSTRFRLALVICLVAIIPLVVSNLLLVRFFERRIIAEREVRLRALANQLARQIQATVPDAVRWDANPVDWQVLHQRIAPMTEELIIDYQDTILGFFSAKANAFVSYAPQSQYKDNLGQPLWENGPVASIYQTKQPLLTRAETRAGPGFFYAYPMVVDDRVIGHTFAIITQVQLNQALWMVRVIAVAGTVLLSLTISTVASSLSGYLTREVNRIIQGLHHRQKGERELASHIPELIPLVTEVELATDTLRQERQRSWNLLDALPLGVMAYSPDHLLSFINETAANTLGISKKDLIGQPRSLILPQTNLVDYQEISLYDEVASGQREAGHHLAHYRDRNGNQWPVHLLMLSYGTGADGERGVLAILYDLRKEIGYERLQGLFDMETHKSQVILETLHLGVVVVDRGGMLTTCNRAAGTLLGLDSVTLLGQRVDTLPRELATILHGSIDGQQRHHQLALTIGDGARELSVDVAPLTTQGGVVAVIGDVTLWNKLQRDAQRSDRLALIGEMAAGTAHEIRNPLTTLRGFLQLLRQRLLSNPELHNELEWIDLMLIEADQINRVVTEFLQLARSKERKVSLIDPAKVVGSLFPVIENECRLRDMVATLVADPDLPLIEADGEQLKQVMLNLAQNGIQAMKKGCTITLSVSHDHAVQQVVIRVIDQGCGIAPENLDHIFNPFFTTREAGTGLGLAICQRIVEDHHGRITVTSEVGVGSTFTIELPVAVHGETEERG